MATKEQIIKEAAELFYDDLCIKIGKATLPYILEENFDTDSYPREIKDLITTARVIQKIYINN